MRNLRYSLALWERWQPKADGEGERLGMTDMLRRGSGIF